MTRPWYDLEADKKHISREREKARQLRKSAWWQARLRRGVCDYCGGKFPPEELSMDHIVPIARGGKTTKGNVAVACRACNASKRLDTPVDRILRSAGGGRGP